ncbi:uncharacterized protein MELLADRAFT_34510 [Melampsora larici-populina 98AG31]|uniref:F-actin-capping protein subunit alpha n=1 Tax=Melampsora larici-populina (strain 98AG31 / pathotype 3-4-7) TaxID=747676 RepID=F4REQ0_MELLP|nr:uncharacterized protein MELLADRAFT_34510 [Melampsora larici-populina 98AG31]EGG09139.1 hypothetical protein MELLADRAFT_34510 [Melampsora larici-populina 98AG31]
MEHEPSLEEKISVASNFILQSPPGEVNDVFNDVRPIVGDDAELENGLLPALSQYNTEQLTLVELPNAKIPAMICEAAKLNEGIENLYMDPNSSQTFIFDHLRLTVKDVKAYTPKKDTIEETRFEISNQAEKYVKEHYQGGVWKVSNEVEDEEKKFQLYIVGNKYNPGNYWTGRWRSIYEIDLTSGTVKGQIQVNVHYYEQGNVSLSSSFLTNSCSGSGSVTASQVIKSISQAETAYQKSVNLAYMELGDDTFKQLRRALPVTKQKIDWNNIKTKIVFNDK